MSDIIFTSPIFFPPPLLKYVDHIIYLIDVSSTKYISSTKYEQNQYMTHLGPYKQFYFFHNFILHLLSAEDSHLLQRPKNIVESQNGRSWLRSLIYLLSFDSVMLTSVNLSCVVYWWSSCYQNFMELNMTFKEDL